jgi:hypothetical protein
MVGEREFLPQLFVQTIDEVPRLLEAKPGYQPLETEVIFFVHHHAERVLGGEQNGGGGGWTHLDVAKQLPRSESPLKKHPTASVIEVRKFEQCGSGEEFNLGHGPPSLLEDGLAIVDPCSRSERMSLEIPSQSNPSRKHDAGMFSAGVEPSEAMVGKGVKVTHSV